MLPQGTRFGSAARPRPTSDDQVGGGGDAGEQHAEPAEERHPALAGSGRRRRRWRRRRRPPSRSPTAAGARTPRSDGPLGQVHEQGARSRRSPAAPTAWLLRVSQRLVAHRLSSGSAGQFGGPRSSATIRSSTSAASPLPDRSSTATSTIVPAPSPARSHPDPSRSHEQRAEQPEQREDHAGERDPLARRLAHLEPHPRLDALELHRAEPVGQLHPLARAQVDAGTAGRRPSSTCSALVVSSTNTDCGTPES